MVVIDTPDGIARYQLGVHIARLRIELNTGMGSRVNVAAAARERYGKFGCDAKDKKKLLEQLIELKRKVDDGEVTLDTAG